MANRNQQSKKIRLLGLVHPEISHGLTGMSHHVSLALKFDRDMTDFSKILRTQVDQAQVLRNGPCFLLDLTMLRLDILTSTQDKMIVYGAKTSAGFKPQVPNPAPFAKSHPPIQFIESRQRDFCVPNLYLAHHRGGNEWILYLTGILGLLITHSSWPLSAAVSPNPYIDGTSPL